MDQGYEHGRQPLDQIMTQTGLENHDLVAVSTDQITHKMIRKARTGRRLSRRVQLKILTALNACSEDHTYQFNDIFTYDGK